MCNDRFDGGTESIGPVGREECAGDVDSFIFEVGPGQFRKKAQRILKEIDVKIGRGMMSVMENG